MAELTYSDLTVSVQSTRRYGNEKKTVVRVDVGNGTNTMPDGGIVLPSNKVAAGNIFGLNLPLRYLNVLGVDNRGRRWQYDPGTNALRCYSVGDIPQVVIDELPTLSGTTTKTGTLKYRPAHIISVTATVSAAVVALKVIPWSATTAAGTVKINWATGAFQSHGETPTVMRFSYIPLQGSGPFSADNLVVDEQVVLSTDKVNLAYRAAALQYIYRTSASAARLTVAHAEASGKVVVDFNDSGNTSIDCHSNENAKNALVTYLKHAGFVNQLVQYVAPATITLTDEEKVWSGKTGLMLPALAQQVITFHDSTTYDEAFLAGPTGTPANGLATFNVSEQHLITAQTGDSETLVDTPFLFVNHGYQEASELPLGFALPATTIYFECIG